MQGHFLAQLVLELRIISLLDVQAKNKNQGKWKNSAAEYARSYYALFSLLDCLCSGITDRRKMTLLKIKLK
jgi:hypothetical protein